VAADPASAAMIETCGAQAFGPWRSSLTQRSRSSTRVSGTSSGVRLARFRSIPWSRAAGSGLPSLVGGVQMVLGAVPGPVVDVPGPVVDVSGAGDALAAGYFVGGRGSPCRAHGRAATV